MDPVETAGFGLAAAIKPACFLLLFSYLPGLSWGWLLMSDKRRGVLATAAESVTLSLIIALLTTWPLAELGHFSVSLARTLMVLIVTSGLVAGLFRRRSILGEGLPGLVLAGLSFVLLLALPERGEWILGGWDPGVYLNQGVAVSRTGTFNPPSSGVYSELEPADREVFLRGIPGEREAFPGFAVNAQTGAFEFSFSRMTTMATAIAHQCGGLNAAERINSLLGVLTVIVFAGMLSAAGLHPAATGLATLILLTQPILLYHMHTPASEMLELLVLVGAAFCWINRARSLGFYVLLALLGLVGVLNRISFALYGALLILLVAVTDLAVSSRGRVTAGHLAAIFCLVTGVFSFHVLTPVSADRLSHIVPSIEAVAGVLVWGVLALDLIALQPRWRKVVVENASGIVRPAVLLGFTIFLAVAFGMRPQSLFEFRWNSHTMLPYLGWPVVALATLGFLAMFASRTSCGDPAAMAFVVFMSFVTVIVLKHKHVADLYPWATKRLLPITVPLVAMLVGYGFQWMRTRKWAGAKTIALVVPLIAIALTGRKALEGWGHTEYDGISTALADAAGHMDENDVVVADHFWWGTPLTFIWGKQVLDGEPLWTVKDVARIRKASNALTKLRHEGHRILFLTSTDGGMRVFPGDFGRVRLKWSSGKVTFREINHHRNARGFPLRERASVFRLYELEPG